jgi:hypothetical protein
MRPFSAAIHNSMVMYRSLPDYKNIDSLKFRLSLPQGLMEKHSSGVSCPVYGHLPIELLPKRFTEHFLEHISATGKNIKPPRKSLVCTKHGTSREYTYCCSKYEAGMFQWMFQGLPYKPQLLIQILPMFTYSYYIILYFSILLHYYKGE